KVLSSRGARGLRAREGYIFCFPSVSHALCCRSLPRSEFMHGPISDATTGEAPLAADLPWYRTLTGYQWFVFIVCCLAWDMDCTDQQLFNLARRPAMLDLVPVVSKDDPRVPDLTRKLTEQSTKDEKAAPTEQEVLDSL